MKFRLVPLAAMVACSLVLSACGSLHKPHIWPFYKKPKLGPQAVNELNLVNPDGTPSAFPQYWKRNTLVIDLSGISGAGSFAARLPEEHLWPVRVAVRVRPGSVQQIEIQGEERNVLPVTPDGTLPIDLEFAPSVYRPTTAAIYISWGSMPAFAAAPGAEVDESMPAAPTGVLPPNTMPALNIVWNCEGCQRNALIIPLLQQSYREEAARQRRAISNAETADVFIVDFNQRDPNKRAWLGIMAGKDRLGVKIRFRGQILEASDYSANAWKGQNHLCETVGEKTFKQIRKAL